MLPHEIESFADNQMNALKLTAESIGFYIDHPKDINPLIIRKWYSDVYSYIDGFDRLKTCMVYETEKRKRYRQILTDLQSSFPSERTF